MLCETSNIVVIKDVLEHLSETWAQCNEYPKEIVDLALKTESLNAKRAAINIMDSWGAFDKLEVILKDEKQNPLIRCEAMRALGRSGKRELVNSIVSISATDSLGFGEACFSALETFHHNGIFIGEEHLDDLITVFIENCKCSEKIFEMITFTCREQLVCKIGSLKGDIYLWDRLCLVIPLIQTSGKIRMVIDVLERISDITIKKRLIKVIGIIGSKGEEEFVLRYMEECPEECLYALKYIGSEKTVDILWALLGVDEKEYAVPPYLLPYSKEALVILWHLCDEKKQSILKSKINPNNIPSGIVDDILPTLGKQDLRLLLFKKDELLVEEMIPTLCQYGGTEVIKEIKELFMRHVSELSTNTYSKSSCMAEYNSVLDGKEPVVFDSIRKAIIKFGENLFNRGKLRPAYLLRAKTANEAGEILLSEIVLQIIETKTLATDEIRILLEVLEDLEYYDTSSRIRKLIRSKEPQIRKMVIRCLVKHHAVGYSFDILRLLEEDDIETVRQAIIAMEEFNARWASSFVVKYLEHPNMNIKKTAAKALIKIGDYKTAKRIIFWLGYHDNLQFRQILIDALRSVAGHAYLSLILNELESSIDERKSELLVKALDGNINKELVISLIRNNHKASSIIIDALIDEKIKLLNGNLFELINNENAMYKANLEKLLKENELLKDKVHISNIFTYINEEGRWDENQVKDLFKKRTLSESELEFFLLNFLREWLEVINETGHVSQDSLGKFLEIAEKSFNDKHYKILAEKVFVMIKVLESNILSLDLGERFVKILHKVFGMLPKAVAIKVVEMLRRIPFIMIPEYNWIYKLIKQCNCILLDSDIYNAIYKLDHIKDRINLLEDAYGFKFINGGANDKITEVIKNKDGFKCDQYNKMLEQLFNNVANNSNKNEFDLLNEIHPLNVPTWKERKAEESKKEIEIMKISSSKEKVIYNNQYKEYLLELLNDKEIHVREKAAVSILDWDGAKLAHKQVMSDYLDGKFRLDEAYKEKLLKILPLFTNEWYFEQIVKQSDEWHLRLIDLISKINVFERQEYIPWLYKTWRHGGNLSSIKAYKSLVGADSSLLIDISIKHSKDEQDLLIKDCYCLKDYNIILQQLDKSGLLNAKNIKPLFLSEVETAELENTYWGLHELVSADDSKNISNESLKANLISNARSNDNEKVMMALKELVRFSDKDVIKVLVELTDHKDLKVRSKAYRYLRQIADKDLYLSLTCKLLHDTRIDVKKSAIRTLSHARYEPAIPAIIDLLSSNSLKLRECAAKGLKIMGDCTISNLKKAEKKARPDHQHIYREIIESILGKDMILPNI